MGRYERMICYLYEYQDGHKGANVGYVKLEKRGEQCRVLIQMRRADLATLPQAALFQQEKTGVLLIPIGVMRDNNGSMKGQYEGNVDNLAGTGLSLDDVHGVLVYVEEGHYFASTWNLEQIDARQLRWWQGDQHEDAGKAEALPKGGSETSQDMVVSSDSSNGTPQNMVISADRSSETLQNMVASADSSNEATQNMVVSSDSSNGTPQNVVISSDRSSEAPQNMVASSDSSNETPQRFADHLASAQAGISRKPENASMERCSQAAEVTGQSISAQRIGLWQKNVAYFSGDASVWGTLSRTMRANRAAGYWMFADENVVPFRESVFNAGIFSISPFDLYGMGERICHRCSGHL